jgi:PTH2 family peptidyl-tRNA hydrolase
MLKQVILIRKDIKMGLGKAIAQACHASLASAFKCKRETVEEWMEEGGKKVVLKANLKEILEAEKKARKAKIPSFLVIDAGLTQLEPGTVTALGIGPDEEKKIDKITGKLKLL